MAKRGTKVVEFEFDFVYSHEGESQIANSITLKTPGLGLFHIHTEMEGWMGEVEVGAIKNFAEIEQYLKKDKDDRDLKSDEKDKTADLMVIRTGLGVKKYPQFCKYVKDVLTDRKKIASIGDTDAPITDLVWQSIEDEGGTEQVMRLIAEFSDFFIQGSTA